MPPEPRPSATDTTGQPSWIAPVMPAIPDHELIKRIGGGSYGDVWLARNVVGTWRAVKVVFRDRFTDARPYEREFSGMKKFEPLSRSNEGFIDILQIGRNDAAGYFYYIMELADDAVVVPSNQLSVISDQSPASAPSASLDHRLITDHGLLNTAANPDTYVPKTLAKALLQRGRLPVSECLDLGLTLNLALGHLHRAGLIHRDVKPSNIIFVGGVPKLADIGLVIETSEARSYVGTEGFIPLEGPNSPQADIYSLGKVLYEAGMGKDRKDFPEPFTKITETPDANELLEFNAILLKACAASVTERYLSAEEMNADLALLQSGGSVRQQRALSRRLRFVQRAGAVVTVVAALIGAGWLYQARQTRIVRNLAADKTRLADEKTKLAEEKTLLAEENRERLVRLNIANGVRLLDEGDPSGALLWFAEALPLVTNRPPEEAIHRIRIQQTLNQMPRPTHVLAHEEQVMAFAFSPDGRRLATTTDWSGFLHLWDIQSSTPVWKPLHLEADWIDQIKFTPDGQRLLVSTVSERGVAVPPLGWIFTNSAAVIDAASGKPLFAKVATNLIRADFTPDGRWLVTAERDHIIRVLDVQDGSQVATLKGHTKDIDKFSFSANGALLASTSKDRTIRLWRLPSGEPVGFPISYKPPMPPAVLSPDGKRIATSEKVARDGVTNSVIRIWSTETSTSVGKPIEVPDERTAIQFDPLTSRRVLVLLDNQARCFDSDTGTELLRAMQSDKPTHYWTITSDGRRLALGDRDGMAGIWSLDTGERLAAPFKYGRRILDIAFNPDGSQLMMITDENAATLWSLNPRTEDASYRLSADLANQGPFPLERFSRDRRRFLVSLEGRSVSLVDVASLTEQKLPTRAGYKVFGPRFHPSGRQWFIDYGPAEGTGTHFAELWLEEAGALRSFVLLHPQGIHNMGFAPDGGSLVTTGDDRQIRIWNTVDGTLERSIPFPEGFDGGYFFPDGRTAFFIDRDQRKHGFVLFDIETARVTRTRIPSAGLRWPFAFDSTCERFATVTEEQWGRVWSNRTGEALTPPVRHGGALTWADWSPDDKRIVMAGETPEVRVWDASTGELVLPPLRLGDKPIVTAMWSLDSRFIVARSDENLVRVWDASTGEPVTPILKHSDFVSLANLAANNRLVTITKPNLMRVWDLKENPFAPDLLAEYAKLLSGRKLNSAGVILPIKADELAELNRLLRTRAPQLFE